MPPSLLYTFPCFPPPSYKSQLPCLGLKEAQYALVPAILPSSLCHAVHTQGVPRSLRFPAYAILFLIHMPLYMASLSSGMSSHSSPAEPLANSYSSIKTMFWYHFLKKAFHAYHQPLPQVRLCALTLNNSWKCALLLGPFVDGTIGTIRQKHLP